LHKQDQVEISHACSKVQKPEVQGSSYAVLTNLKQSTILVHFEYSEHTFPKRITAETFREFYNEVFFALQNKMLNYKPCNIQFMCGSKWYDFNQDVGFDGLCLDDSSELLIQATPTPIKLGNFIMQIS